MKKQKDIIPSTEFEAVVLALNPITKSINESGLPAARIATLNEAYGQIIEQAQEATTKAMGIVVVDSSDAANIAAAKEAYDELNQYAKRIEEVRKATKQASLDEGRAIDRIAADLKAVIEPALSHAKNQKDYIKLKLAAEKATRHAARVTEISPYTGYFDQTADFGGMSEEQYQSVLSIATKAKADADEAARLKAEKEAAERIEMERLREVERLAAIERTEASRREREAAEAARLKALEDVRTGVVKIEIPTPPAPTPSPEAQPMAPTPPAAPVAPPVAPVAPPKAPSQNPFERVAPPTAQTLSPIHGYLDQLKGIHKPVLLNQKDAQIINHAHGTIEKIIAWLESQV